MNLRRMENQHVVLHEIDLGSLMNSSNMLWVSGILASLPIVLMVAIAVAVVHGNRTRRKNRRDGPDAP